MGRKFEAVFFLHKLYMTFTKTRGKWLVWGHIFTSGREYCSNGLISVFFMAVSAPSESWGALIGGRWFGGFAAVFFDLSKIILSILFQIIII